MSNDLQELWDDFDQYGTSIVGIGADPSISEQQNFVIRDEKDDVERQEREVMLHYKEFLNIVAIALLEHYPDGVIPDPPPEDW